ncbi:tyrosine--tRNA ligase, mitochondrial-like isoform X1 [Artemia franciscana]|uniref:tyrosine--tRNA ligase, mitochondrial-like isoform X1 n=1 Tax=Artemia franciscana TaxID=6661 RepID=UPI0032DB4214
MSILAKSLKMAKFSKLLGHAIYFQNCYFLTNRRLASSAKSILKLSERGIWQDVFPSINNVELHKLLAVRQAIYTGFDPTAESLHIGNLLVLITLIRCSRAGHTPIALVGGATALVGDPSGKSTERPALEKDAVLRNIEGIRNNIKNIFRNHQELYWPKEKKLPELKIVNNEDWYTSQSIIDFLSDVGRYFRVGTMLGRHSVQSRLNSDQGISYTEFSYQVLQAYDWYHLYNKHGCRFQIGGSDQMGNIVSGHDLIKRKSGVEVFGLTLPLVTTESGDKLGKSAGNAIWLSENKTSSFEFYQFFIRTKDGDVEKLLKYFTFLPLEHIDEIMAKQKDKPESRTAQRKLAEHVTKLVHGEEGLKSAKRITEALYFSSVESLSQLSQNEIEQLSQNMPVVDIFFAPDMNLLELGMAAKCFASESDALRIMAAGGFYINGERETNPQLVATSRFILPSGITLLRTGFGMAWMDLDEL